MGLVIIYIYIYMGIKNKKEKIYGYPIPDRIDFSLPDTRSVIWSGFEKVESDGLKPDRVGSGTLYPTPNAHPLHYLQDF